MGSYEAWLIFLSLLLARIRVCVVEVNCGSHSQHGHSESCGMFRGSSCLSQTKSVSLRMVWITSSIRRHDVSRKSISSVTQGVIRVQLDVFSEVRWVAVFFVFGSFFQWDSLWNICLFVLVLSLGGDYFFLLYTVSFLFLNEIHESTSPSVIQLLLCCFPYRSSPCPFPYGICIMHAYVIYMHIYAYMYTQSYYVQLILPACIWV